LGDAEDSYLAAINQRAHTRAGKHITKVADLGPTCTHATASTFSSTAVAPPAEDSALPGSRRSTRVAGRICPRSLTNTTLESVAVLLTKCRNRLRVTGSSTAFFHSHSYVATIRAMSASSSSAMPSSSRQTTPLR